MKLNVPLFGSLIFLTSCLHLPLPFRTEKLTASQIDPAERQQIVTAISNALQQDGESEVWGLIESTDLTKRAWLTRAMLAHHYLVGSSRTVSFNPNFGRPCRMVSRPCRKYVIARLSFLELTGLHRSDAAGKLGRVIDFTIRAKPVGFIGNLLASKGALYCEGPSPSNRWYGEDTVGYGGADTNEYGAPNIDHISRYCPQRFYE